MRAYREAPSTARRGAVAAYIAGHPKDAALANLALGIAEYEQKNYAGAIAELKPVQGKLAPLADYAAYYLALARVEANDFEVTGADLTAAHGNSPLNGKSWLVEARARKATAAADAVRLLREHYAELPQPEGDVTLADCYQAANDLAHAAEFYQRIYYHYLTGAASARAAVALITLKDAMGSNYPPPAAAQVLHRGDRLMEAAEYALARQEYQAAAAIAGGVERDQALVRMGAADFLAGRTASASPYLRGLEIADSEAAAERLYYLVECARRRNDDAEMMSTLQQLAARYRQSPWRLKASTSAANRYLLSNRPDDYVPLYQVGLPGFSRLRRRPRGPLEGGVPGLPARSGGRCPACCRSSCSSIRGTLRRERHCIFWGAGWNARVTPPARAPAIRSWPRRSRITTTRCWPATG